MVCHLPFGPTAYFTLYNVVMRHDVPDIGTISEAYPHLIFHNFTSRLGKRVSGWWPLHCTYPVDILFPLLFVREMNLLCAHRYRISSSIFFQCQRRIVDVLSRLPTKMTSSLSGQCMKRSPQCKCHADFAIWNDRIQFNSSFLNARHHTYKKTDHKNIELTEVGPRFEMKCKY